MTRLLLAILAVSLIATTSLAVEPPKAMPGNTEPAKSAPTVATPGAVPDATCNANGCCDASGCCERPGVLARINARWCGHRCAHIEPNPCTNNFPSYGNYAPIITSYQSRCCLKSDDRCRRFGVGRFFNRCKTEKDVECKDSLYLRLRARLGLRRCKNDAHSKCTPTPYHSPVRYYFQPDGEPVCSGGGCAEGCTTISPGGRIPRTGRCVNAAECVERQSVLGRLRGMLNGVGCRDGAGCRDGHCRRKEECYGIPGSHFNGDLRFARDEKMKFAPIVASEGIDYRGGWHFDLQRIKAEENPVITAGYKTPAK